MMAIPALIVIDIQNEYFPGGKLALERPEAAAACAAQLVKVFRDKGLFIVHVQHENINPEVQFMLPGSCGQEIHTSVTPIDTEQQIIKHYPNAFWQTELEGLLKAQGITELVIVGMMTHMCVSSTARAGMERGFDITVIQDACATLRLELDGVNIPADTVQRTALAELTLFAQIRTLEVYLNTAV